ncbi:hypothetical protein AB0G02_41785, partial [Actinosynnema sp. NPDC023658]|uniref:hypothetical protein n=1 Tax=Actinosynnema sp. NPDC023658 TaxID=3155465 RepID=UPI0033E390F5
VGLYTITSVDVDRSTGCTVLTVADAGFLDATGWARCPGPVSVRPTPEGYQYTPFDGSWYRFRLVW